MERSELAARYQKTIDFVRAVISHELHDPHNKMALPVHATPTSMARNQNMVGIFYGCEAMTEARMARLTGISRERVHQVLEKQLTDWWKRAPEEIQRAYPYQEFAYQKPAEELIEKVGAAKKYQRLAEQIHNTDNRRALNKLFQEEVNYEFLAYEYRHGLTTAVTLTSIAKSAGIIFSPRAVPAIAEQLRKQGVLVTPVSKGWLKRGVEKIYYLIPEQDKARTVQLLEQVS